MNELDHLVVAARTLEEGVAWCEATLGVTPGPGGKHPLMGTHNRLAQLSSASFPRAYLEIIAIDPLAPAPDRVRWYDLDDPAMQQSLTRGPRLIHWVARSTNLRADLDALAAAGWDGGEALRIERGHLRWQIGVRPDGRRLCDGALPTLIEWGDQHPCDDMPASGLSLLSMVVDGLPASAAAALTSPSARIDTNPGAHRLLASLSTPAGRVELRSDSST